MKRVSSLSMHAIVIVLVCMSLTALSYAEGAKPVAPKKLDICTILSVTEIKDIIGKPVSEGKLNLEANPALGTPCEYKIGDSGVFSLWIGQNQGQTCDKMKTEMAKASLKIIDAPNIGDCSFFADEGFSIMQLNTWKGSTYLIITLMIPGVDATQQKTIAEKLMKLCLQKL